MYLVHTFLKKGHGFKTMINTSTPKTFQVTLMTNILLITPL